MFCGELNTRYVTDYENGLFVVCFAVVRFKMFF